ncbi:unnamed protein product [Rotaria sp. Silwood2]|nr:unnamed protein product [Rotaria sp. Silwood2]CAF2879436.1 unnamed protein product [Rotaria sp. Silwood2]CAF3170095.1 unnamed protein product [Rotaria sp. Silwood2]CAF3379084.1 unnamed protein product [Rotaria sp. Silwood2]
MVSGSTLEVVEHGNSKDKSNDAAGDEENQKALLSGIPITRGNYLNVKLLQAHEQYNYKMISKKSKKKFL